MHTKKQRNVYWRKSVHKSFSVRCAQNTAVSSQFNEASSQLWLGVGDEKHFNFNQWERRLSNKWPIGCRIDSLSIPSRNIFDNSIIFGFLNMSVSPFRYWLSGESNRATVSMSMILTNSHMIWLSEDFSHTPGQNTFIKKIWTSPGTSMGLIPMYLVWDHFGTFSKIWDLL